MSLLQSYKRQSYESRNRHQAIYEWAGRSRVQDWLEIDPSTGLNRAISIAQPLCLGKSKLRDKCEVCGVSVQDLHSKFKMPLYWRMVVLGKVEVISSPVCASPRKVSLKKV